MKNWFKVVRAITLVGQLGFTLLTPPVATQPPKSEQERQDEY